MDTSFRFSLAAVTVLALTGTPARLETKLQGAGATFPAPLYLRLVAEYQKLHPDVKVDYQAIGSGGGIKAITDATVDFAGSDAPLGKKEQATLGDGNVVQIPSCAGAVVPAYNVPGVTAELRFTGELLADIYLGKVGKWNDARLVAINPGVKLPDLAITPVWRTDGSGTSYVFTNYLCTQSQPFRENIGAGKEVKWSVGQGGKGNQGVTAVVQSTKGSLGYIEQNYADENHVEYGAVCNKAGKYIKASAASVSKAGAAAAPSMSGSVLAADLWNQDGDESYPIASLTYLIVYKDLKNLGSSEEAQALMSFLWWAVHDGQAYAPKLGYAPLAAEMTKKVEAALAGVTFQGAVLKTP